MLFAGFVGVDLLAYRGSKKGNATLAAYPICPDAPMQATEEVMLRRMISRLVCSGFGMIALLACANGENIKVPQVKVPEVHTSTVHGPKINASKFGTTGKAADFGANTGYTSAGIPPQGQVIYNTNSDPPTVTIDGRTMKIDKNTPKFVAEALSGKIMQWVNGQLVPVGKQ